MIAASVDGLSIILGTIGNKEPFTFFKLLASIIAIPQLGWKKIVATLKKNNEQEDIPFQLEIQTLNDSTRILRLVNIDAHQFLTKLLSCVDFDTHVIHLDELFGNNELDRSRYNKKENKNDEYSITAYRILIDTIASLPFNWLEEYQEENIINAQCQLIENRKKSNESKKLLPKTWKIKDECYRNFITWLRIEIANEAIRQQAHTEMLIDLEIS